MGTLAVMTYPTVLALRAADHTYVVCGAGTKAWSCWGGKSGGTRLRAAGGSTKQADAIADLDEKAGIRCYLINGICHQAANRILLPALIFVRGARGYDLSEVVFGPYGRPRGRLGMCRAPFQQHLGVMGDFPECELSSDSRGLFVLLRRLIDQLGRAVDRTYLRGVLEIYDRSSPAFESEAGFGDDDLEDFHLSLFMYKVHYSLGSNVDNRLARRLREIRLSYERDRIRIENEFAGREAAAATFVTAFEERTMRLQAEFADVLDDAQYKRLLGLERNERITLVDPAIAKHAFGR